MKNDGTQWIRHTIWQNPRLHFRDDMWLLTIFAMLLAIGIPWLSGGLDVQIGIASWGLLALGGIHVLFNILASPLLYLGRWRDNVLTLLDAIGVVLIGFVWAHVGGLQNPLFLAVFALPVTGSIFLSRWHPFLLASLSVLVVDIVALSQAPELRAYLRGWLGGASGLVDVFSRFSVAPRVSFPGFYAPTGYLVVMLEVFAVVLFACAVTAEYVGTIFERLLANRSLARTEREKAHESWVQLIGRLPLPALLIDPSSLRIVGCSDAARRYLRCGEESLDSRDLFDVVRFSFTDLVQGLISEASGIPSLTTMHLSDEVRLTQATVMRVVHRNRHLALLTIEDVTETFFLKAAWDTSDYAVLVIDALGRVRTFNKPAARLFNGIEVGVYTDRFLSHRVAGLPWWDPGLARRRKMHLEIGSRIYEVKSSEISLPGVEERLSSVSLLAVARADPLDGTHGATPPTLHTPAEYAEQPVVRQQLR
ncbi:MAG TPA: PAS domain-containing protein [Steroidobacteraceae bacterium]